MASSGSEDDGPAFMGGSLNLKGDKKKKSKKDKKKKDKKRSREEAAAETTATTIQSDSDDELTEAELKAKKFRREQTDKKELEKVAELSHRERINAFNEKLGSLTEHNDIPRVSAAGNG